MILVSVIKYDEMMICCFRPVLLANPEPDLEPGSSGFVWTELISLFHLAMVWDFCHMHHVLYVHTCILHSTDDEI